MILGQDEPGLYLMFNASGEAAEFTLARPPKGELWHLAVDTFAQAPRDLFECGQEIKVAYGVRAAGEHAARLNRIHEVKGAVIARRILEERGYEPKLIEQIAAIIENHDSGTQIRSLEEALVKDSDKLWRVSQVGFWAEGRRQGVEPEERYRFLKERYQKWFFTKSALAEAEMELAKRGRAIFSGTTPRSQP